MTPVDNHPVTLASVRNISGMVSTASSIAIPASGIPTDVRMGVITMIAPPGIPGTVRLTATALTIVSCSVRGGTATGNPPFTQVGFGRRPITPVGTGITRPIS